jgi:Zn-dependent alcohol dehydrogenase
VLFGTADIQRDIPRMVAHYQAGRLDLDRLVTATFSLDQINDGLAALDHGEVVSAVIEL